MLSNVLHRHVRVTKNRGKEFQRIYGCSLKPVMIMYFTETNKWVNVTELSRLILANLLGSSNFIFTHLS